jgi:hypothetical protein
MPRTTPRVWVEVSGSASRSGADGEVIGRQRSIHVCLSEHQMARTRVRRLLVQPTAFRRFRISSHADHDVMNRLGRLARSVSQRVPFPEATRTAAVRALGCEWRRRRQLPLRDDARERFLELQIDAERSQQRGRSV